MSKPFRALQEGFVKKGGRNCVKNPTPRPSPPAPLKPKTKTTSSLVDNKLALSALEKYANGELDILDDFEYYSVFLEAVEQISNKTITLYSEEDDLYSETTVFHLNHDCYLHFTSTYDKETKDILYEEIQYFTPEYFYE